MVRSKKSLKKALVILLTIIFLDFGFYLTSSQNIDWRLTLFNLGFTSLILMIATPLIVLRLKKIKITDGIIVGGISLSLRALLAFPVASLFSGIYIYNSYLIFVLCVKGFIQGISYGAFAAWFSEKVVK